MKNEEKVIKTIQRERKKKRGWKDQKRKNKQRKNR